MKDEKHPREFDVQFGGVSALNPWIYIYIYIYVYIWVPEADEPRHGRRAVETSEGGPRSASRVQLARDLSIFSQPSLSQPSKFLI